MGDLVKRKAKDNTMTTKPYTEAQVNSMTFTARSDDAYFVVMTIFSMCFLFIGTVAAGLISSAAFIAGGFYLGHVFTQVFKGE